MGILCAEEHGQDGVAGGPEAEIIPSPSAGISRRRFPTRRRWGCAGRWAIRSRRRFRRETSSTSAWRWMWRRTTSRWRRMKSRRCWRRTRRGADLPPGQRRLARIAAQQHEKRPLAGCCGGELLDHGQQQLAVALVQVGGVAANLGEEAQLVVGEAAAVLSWRPSESSAKNWAMGRSSARAIFDSVSSEGTVCPFSTRER